MIITCPTCATRYRQPPSAGDSPVKCSCSRCEAVFPSDSRTTTDSITRSAAADNMVLAISARLEPEAPAAVHPLMLSVDGPVPGEPVGLAGLPVGMDDPTLAPKIRDGSPEPHVIAAPLTYSAFAEDDPVEEVDGEPVQAAETVPESDLQLKDTRPGFGAFMVVTSLPTAMAAGAWQLSTTFGEDPMIWMTPAGVLGLLFSWLWVRWKYREG